MSLDIESEWAGWNNRGIHDKVWAACYTRDGQYLAVWGRRDTKYQSLRKPSIRMDFAAQEFYRMINSKLGKGYKAVPFNDSRYGNIPSFRYGAAPAPAGPHQPLTVAAVITRARALVAKAGRSASDAVLAQSLMEWKQITALIELFLDVPGVSAGDRATLTAMHTTLHTQVIDRLFA